MIICVTKAHLLSSLSFHHHHHLCHKGSSVIITVISSSSFLSQRCICYHHCHFRHHYHHTHAWDFIIITDTFIIILPFAVTCFSLGCSSVAVLDSECAAWLHLPLQSRSPGPGLCKNNTQQSRSPGPGLCRNNTQQSRSPGLALHSVITTHTAKLVTWPWSL